MDIPLNDQLAWVFHVVRQALGRLPIEKGHALLEGDHAP
jgi:hypothetical protein